MDRSRGPEITKQVEFYRTLYVPISPLAERDSNSVVQFGKYGTPNEMTARTPRLPIIALQPARQVKSKHMHSCSKDNAEP